MAKRKPKEVTIGDQLREAITNSGKSSYEIAAESGVSQPQLSRFLRGERDLQLATASKVCEALGLKLRKE